MAQIPTPRSVQQIIGDMVDVYLSRSGSSGSSLKVGGPILSIIEAGATSDVRATQDIFNFLDAIDGSKSTGGALLRFGRSKDVEKQGAQASTGLVTLSDQTFTKISTRVFQGQSAPIVGSTTIYVVDASSFPSTGFVYIGRGTSNLEGPIAYSSPTSISSGAYWSLTVGAGTQRFHNLGETVVLAQRGDRTVGAGQSVQTPQGNAQDAVSFITTQQVVILDGETEVTNVPVVCETAGIIGNVPAGSIRVVSSPAFTGMAVTNPSRFDNGQDQENDEAYRERIFAAEQSRSRGTPLAIKTGTLYLTAPDESGRIISTSMVAGQGRPSVLYIDDGTGYEEKTAGVAQETLMDQAVGGEKYFQLAERPVAQAFVKTSSSAPFPLTTGAKLAILVGGVRSEHTFDTADFRDIGNATAFEVVASVNANSELLFQARTTGNGTACSFFARSTLNDDLQVVEPVSGIDANDVLVMTSGRVDTVKLYLNDRLLYKDGLAAQVSSQPQSFWIGFAESDTLVLSVDGTPAVTYTFTGQDFVNQATGYAGVSETNSLAAWATVINAKIPGITCTVSGGGLVLRSNLGLAERARVTVSATSTLVTKGMFDATQLSAQGADYDFSLDPNLGRVTLASALAAGDYLTAGSVNTRAYIESAAFSPTVTLGSTGNQWWVVDGAASVVLHGVTAATTIQTSISTATPNRRLTASTAAFTNIQVGDWVVIWDPAFSNVSSYVPGTWRVCNVDPLGTWFEFDVGTAGSTTTFNSGTGYTTAFVSGGITFVKTQSIPQKVSFSAGTYGPADVATTLAAGLTGANAATYKTSKVRVATNTYGTNGEIMLVAADVDAQTIPFTLGIQDSQLAHIPVIETGNEEVGTPTFNFAKVATNPSSTSITLAQAIDVIGGTNNSQLAWVHTLPNTSFKNRFGQNTGDHTMIATNTAGTLALRHVRVTPVNGGASYESDRLYAASTFGIGPEDNLDVQLDGDATSKNYNIGLARRTQADSAVAYSTTLRLKDLDNLTVLGVARALSSAFGTSFSFNDFAVYAKARNITNKGTANREALWRFGRFGPEGNNATIQYAKPTVSATPLSITTTAGSTFDISVVLPSGARKGSTIINSLERFNTKSNVNTATGSRRTYFCGFTVSSLARVSNVTTLTLSASGDATDCKYQIGDVIYVTNAPAGFTSGQKTLTGKTALTISYSEVAADQGATPGVLTYTSWTTSIPSFSTTLSANDIVNVSNQTSLDATVQGVFAILDAGIMWFRVYCPLETAVYSAGYAAVNSADAIQFYPIDQSSSGTGATPPTVTQLVTAANALGTGIVTGTVLGTGAGTIIRSSEDDYLISGGTYPLPLVDGVNYVSATTYNGGAANYDLTLKNAVSANLSAPNDFTNEQFRLTPQTATNLSAFISTAGVGGLTAGGGALQASTRARKLQLTSPTIGSSGAIQVLGGAGNSSTATLTGSPTISGSVLINQIQLADATGFYGNQWVSIDTSTTVQKVLDWTGSTTLALDGATKKVTVAGAGTGWRYSGSVSAPVAGGTWWVERHGKFTAYVLANDDQAVPSVDFSTAKEGDWVEIAQANGGFTSGPTMGSARSAGAASVVLNDGKVLLVGNAAMSTQCDLYDPATNTITATDVLPAAGRDFTAAVKLQNGTVLVCGGTTGAVTATCYIYNPNAPVASKWTAAASMNAARSSHTATLLNDGTVFVSGGDDGAGNGLNSAEIYNPTTDSWSTIGATMVALRKNHTATLLDSGKVLLAGGQSVTGTDLSSAEVYNPGPQTFTATTTMVQVRSWHAAVKLPNGKVMVLGGRGPGVLNSCRIYDPGTNGWTAGASLVTARNEVSACLLDNGKVLAVGGINASGNNQSCGIYDYIANTWTFTGNLSVARAFPIVSKLQDGTVFVAGGNRGAELTSTEIFDSSLGISAVNTGTFQIVRVIFDTPNKKWAFWTENLASIEERVVIPTVRMLDYNSAMPGDTLVIGANTLGSTNTGLWTVASQDVSNGQVFYLQASPTTIGATLLSTNYPLFQITSASPARFIKQIKYIGVNGAVTGYCDVGFTSTAGSNFISANTGAIMTALDKLEFSTQKALGIDSYQYNTGLIAEANRVVYGEETDPATYPGIAAAGANIGIHGPNIKRVQVSLAIRLRSGKFSEAKIRVQGLVASVINKTGVGQSVALSDLVAAASQAEGVASVTLVYPTYGIGNDLIAVQPFEKPLVLDLDTDIVVTQVGA